MSLWRGESSRIKWLGSAAGGAQESSSRCNFRLGGQKRLAGRITSGQTLEENEGVNLEAIWGKRFSGRGKNSVRKCPMCSRTG